MRTHHLILAAACAALAACAEGGDGSEEAAAPLSTSSTSVVAAWGIPNVRSDGSSLALSELGGYELRYGPAGDGEANSVTINDQTITEYAITDLEPGEYEFSIASFDSSGVRSAFAGPVQVTVVAP